MVAFTPRSVNKSKQEISMGNRKTLETFSQNLQDSELTTTSAEESMVRYN
jgi:hypothetical protein